jgi:hypothetical protein
MWLRVARVFPLPLDEGFTAELERLFCNSANSIQRGRSVPNSSLQILFDGSVLPARRGHRETNLFGGDFRWERIPQGL